MARRTIIGVVTYSTQNNRDAALSRVQGTLASAVYEDFTSAAGTGITTPTTTTINFSISVEDRDEAVAIFRDIYAALTQSNRQSSGYLSVNRI